MSTTTLAAGHRQGAADPASGSASTALPQAGQDRPLGARRASSCSTRCRCSASPFITTDRLRLRRRAVHRRRPTSSWRSASTSWSATPACSTSATSASTPRRLHRRRPRPPSTATWPWLARRCRSRSSSRWSPACILGAPTLRVRGDYLAIVTLGFGEIIRLTVDQHRVARAAAPGHLRHRRGPPERRDSFEIPHLDWSSGVAGRRPRHDDRRSSSSACSTVPYYWLALTVIIARAARRHRWSRTAGSAGPGRRPARTRTPPS